MILSYFVKSLNSFSTVFTTHIIQFIVFSMLTNKNPHSAFSYFTIWGLNKQKTLHKQNQEKNRKKGLAIILLAHKIHRTGTEHNF